MELYVSSETTFFNMKLQLEICPQLSSAEDRGRIDTRRGEKCDEGVLPPNIDRTTHHTITPLLLVYKLTELYDITQVTSRRIESLDKILFPPPPPSHECDDPCLLCLCDPSRAFQCDCQGSKLRITPPPLFTRDPQFVLKLSQDSRESWPWLFLPALHRQPTCD